MAAATNRPRAVPALALACAGLLFAGCSSDREDEQVSSACLANSDAYEAALAAAPQQVLLEGETPISDCLVPEQEAGQLAAVGQQMITAATDLNAAAQSDPGGPEAVQLGYLIGAVEKGFEGIHADLVRRLNTAARFSSAGLLPPEFERAFGRGYAAGLESG